MSFSKQSSAHVFSGMSERTDMPGPLQKQLHAGETGGLEISCPVARCLPLAIKLLPRSP